MSLPEYPVDIVAGLAVWAVAGLALMDRVTEVLGPEHPSVVAVVIVVGILATAFVPAALVVGLIWRLC